MASDGEDADRHDQDGSGRARPRISRRMLLVSGGGFLLAGAAAVLVPLSSGSSGPNPARRLTGVPRQPVRWHAVPARKIVPAEPMYYVNDGPKVIALTIDDGPSPVYTPQILRILEKNNVRAWFSMIGRNVQYYPGIARDVADAGHMIVNHTWDHHDLAVLPQPEMRNDIARATGAIHAATGVRPTMFRAPYGAWSRAVLEYCASVGLRPLDWSVDPEDWALPGVPEIVGNIMDNTRTGSIILEHDGGGDRSETVAALKIVIPRLLDEGYRFSIPA